MKAAAHIAPCVSGQTTAGGLPAYTLPCLGGGTPVELGTLKGPLLINFWSPSCGPCRQEMPALEQFYKKYGSKVPVLGIDTGDPIPRIALQTAISRGVTYPMAEDPRATLSKIKPVAFRSIPITFLLTADGQIKFVSAIAMTSEAEVEQRVKELGAAL